MNNYLVLTKLLHFGNTDKGNNKIHAQIIQANSFAEAELIIKTVWAKVQCDAEIIQISIQADNN